MGFFYLSPPPPPFSGDLSSPMEGLKGEQGHYGGERNGSSEDQESSRDHESGLQSKLCARGHWRPAEDAKLRELVSQHGPQNWNLIAEKLEGRSGKSCRLRWFNQLDPRINRRAFSEEEEERLLAAHRAYGNKWALIASLFPGRTDNAVKNHWHVVMARKQREQSSAYRRKKPFSSLSPTFSASNSNRTLFPKCVQLNTSNNNNACSAESIITSTRDESVSTSTDLSLNSNCSRAAVHGLFIRSLFIDMCPREKLVAARNGGCCEKIGDYVAPLVMVPGADQSAGYSDSKSEASAAESVANNRHTVFFHGEQDYEREKISLPFIDFLGVGAT